MMKEVGWAMQAGLSAGAGPLRSVVADRAGGVKRAGIQSGPRAGKETGKWADWATHGDSAQNR
jgi:hypothetical protein